MVSGSANERTRMRDFWEYWAIVWILIVALAALVAAGSRWMRDWRRERRVKQLIDLGRLRSEAERAADLGL